MTLVHVLQKIHARYKGDTVSDGNYSYTMMTDVESDYEKSKYVSLHNVVIRDLQSLGGGRYYRLSWERTKEDDPEIVEDSVESVSVKPVTHTVTDWVPEYQWEEEEG